MIIEYADFEKLCKFISDITSFIANALTISTAFLALYLYFAKRKEIASAFKLFMNFSYQTTLAELRWKLDKLNEYRVNEPAHVDEIRSLIHDIAGQIRGNDKLNASQPDLVRMLEKFADGNMTEPRKRSIISLVREKIKNIGVDNFEDIMGN
jgi:hypothetical protein